MLATLFVYVCLRLYTSCGMRKLTTLHVAALKGFRIQQHPTVHSNPASHHALPACVVQPSSLSRLVAALVPGLL
jgi:hypothetical protein